MFVGYGEGGSKIALDLGKPRRGVTIGSKPGPENSTKGDHRDTQVAVPRGLLRPCSSQSASILTSPGDGNRYGIDV